MNRLSIPPIILASVTAFVGLYHLLIYLRRREHRENLTFALSCFSMGLYDAFTAGLYSATSAAEGVHWQRAQVVTLALVSIAFPWFVVDYLSRVSRVASRARKWIAGFCVYFALAAVIGALDRSGLVRPMDQPDVKQIQLFYGPTITYYEMAPGPLTNLQSAMGLVAFGYIMGLAVRFYREGHRKEARPLLWAMTLFFAAGINDTAVASGFYEFVYLIEYAYLGMVLLMTYSLTSAVVEAAMVKEALREREAQLQAILDHSPALISIKNLEGEVILVNRNFEVLEGPSPQEYIGRSVFELFPPEVAQALWDNDLAALEAGGPVEAEEVVAHRDATEHTYLTVKFPLYGEDGRPFGVCAISTDITSRKEAEKRALRLQHLLQNITDSMPSTLVTLDMAGRVLTWNPAAQALTGRDRSQVEGELLWLACPELSGYRELFERVVREGRTAHLHREQAPGEAGVVYRDVSAFPLEADGVDGVVLRIDDVTDRVELEEMMLQSAKMASVGALAAGVAHEINNPLGAIMQSAQMLQIALDIGRPRTRQRLQEAGVDPDGLGRYRDARRINQYLEGIRSSGERAAKIVTDLLSFSRRRASKTAPHDLGALVEQALNLAAADYDLKRGYDFREVEIALELSPDLPEVVCDGQQIQQVLLNLVRNAAQAMAEKGRQEQEPAYRPRLTLRTALRHGGRGRDWVRLEVEDNGPGMPDAVRARIFEPFFTTKALGEGTGLGLWLCWSIVVERHGGKIWAEAPAPAAGETGGGSRFVVELPVRGKVRP